MTTFRSPRSPALAIRTESRYLKFAGGVLEVTAPDAEVVRDWIAAHPTAGVVEAPKGNAARRAVQASTEPTATADETASEASGK